MAHTFDDLVAMQRAADHAHAEVQRLRAEYGPPTTVEWTDEQTLAYETAWKRWREQAQSVQAAVTERAIAKGTPRVEVEAAVKKAARHPAE